MLINHILEAVIFIVVFCVVIMITRSYCVRSKQLNIENKNEITLDIESIVNRLSKVIQFRTISYKDSSRVDNEEFERLSTYIKESFPMLHSNLEVENIGEHSLLYMWKGTSNSLKPMLLTAHLDVVPVEPGTENDWKYPAFSGAVREGYIWGRGTIDDKVNVMAILESIEYLINKNFTPQRTVYIAFGEDEEIEGKKGAGRIAKLLKERNIELDFIVDEGGAVIEGALPGIMEPVALVGTSEKGYVCFELTAQGNEGHSSMPIGETAIGILSKAVAKIEKKSPPSRISGSTRQLIEFLGPETKFLYKLLFTNLWITKKIICRVLSKSPITNATIRTTTVVTMFNGGVKANVIPRKAKAIINCRILPGDNIDAIKEYLRKIINDSRVNITVMEDRFEASNVSDVNEEGFKKLQKTIMQIYPRAIISPFLAMGASDSRHYKQISKNIYRFSPFLGTLKDIQRAHSTNERISIENYKNAVRFYIQFIINVQ
ncbi:MAG: M20 family peptidase [Bacillota bacterium]|nr:M20 family peptidase [Bacillota bacterium]